MTFAERPFIIANADTELAVDVDAWHSDVRRRALKRAAAPPHRLPRPLWIGALAAALLLHLLLGLWLRDLMRPQVVEDRDRILVTLIDALPPEPPLPVAPPRAAAPSTSAARPQAAAPARNGAIAPRAQSTLPVHDAAAVTTQSTQPAPQFRAYNPDGSLNVPKDLVEQIDAMRPKPNFIAKSIAPSPIMLPHRPLKIRPNHFDQYWRGSGWTLLDDVSQFVDDNLVKKKIFTDSSGGQYECVWALIIVTCMDVPRKAWEPPPEKWKPASVLDEH
ncbi:MAG TPA: hypothetical protein VIE67_08520 [Rudaea sp.]|jgi:hypothetical protein|uniref:hypothetical protein n=1 Tax=Rudaea sp. TaxID=2136325 RepID=UPI002F9212DA